MHITPKQRRRALRVHYLRQQGHTLKKIAETQKVSVDTVRADLQLVQTHWSSIASAAADDLLLESLHVLDIRLSLATKRDTFKALANRLTPVEFLRAEDARDTQLNALAREIRRTVQQVHQRAEQRPNQHEDQPELYDEEPQEETKPAETTPKSSQIEPSISTISSPEQQIVESAAEKEKLPEEPDQDTLIEEAIQHFPHLKGQSPEKILQFLDQITNPETQDQEIPTKIYAEAAG